MNKPDNTLFIAPVPSTSDLLLNRLLDVTRFFLKPSFEGLNGFLITTFMRTLEDQKRGVNLVPRIFFTLVYILLLLLTLPLVIVFFPLRNTILYMRKPYRYSVKHTAYTLKKCESHKRANELGNLEFSIATANILLPPECISRYNNMKDSHLKGKELGERIVIDQFFPRCHQNSSSDAEEVWLSNGNTHKSYDGVEGQIRTHFSSLDFLCLQETFCNYHNKALLEELHKVYPYIIYDAGVNSFKYNKFVMNSGLMVVSQYPIAAADFKPFNSFIWPSTIIGSGALMAKVVLWSGDAGAGEIQRVGYITNVHLQPYQGDVPIVCKQLDEILAFVEEFMLKTTRPGDQVMFNMLCGDFNSDNMSPCDCDSANHDFFNIYKDYGRVCPGKEKDWAMGTELCQINMHDQIMSTPKSLKMVVEDPCLRRTHFVDANLQTSSLDSIVLGLPPTDTNGKVITASYGGRRRVDLITFHSKYPLNVKSYDFVTRLASLTDHLPVQMSFSCPVSRLT